MFPRVTHPSAADVSRRPLDLHVLSLPPAFVLSQDQTLRLNRDLSRPVTQIPVRPSQERTRSDEFQTHPLKTPIRPNRLPTLSPAWPQANLGNVTVAISSDPDQTQPSRPRSRKKPPKPKPSQGPARTPPPTSPFLPMQLSNSNPRASAPAT